MSIEQKAREYVFGYMEWHCDNDARPIWPLTVIDIVAQAMADPRLPHEPTMPELAGRPCSFHARCDEIEGDMS